MSNTGILSAYRQNSVQGASPVGLLLVLYDTVIRDFRRAMEAMDRGDVEMRVHELNHALTVIAHLKSVLDHQRGGEAASRFENFYEVSRGMILSVNVNSSRETLTKLIDMFSSMRQAWHQAETLIAK
ncbi:MAG TPA: flagellar export chaperone FliS [Candidatus Dormibacteraeota bacterium]|jgi:flagellar protein FliS|nr:flagellar export chaperone FliS [Candidatus Dormibacteraeota bacterium]